AQCVADYAAAQGITWRQKRDNLVSNCRVLEGVDRPTSEAYLTLERLRIFARRLGGCNFSWFCERADPGEPASQLSIAEWKDWARTDRVQFASRVKKTLHRAQLAACHDDHLARWQKRLAARAPARAIPAFGGQAPQPSATYACYECGRAEPTEQRLRARVTRCRANASSATSQREINQQALRQQQQRNRRAGRPSDWAERPFLQAQPPELDDHSDPSDDNVSMGIPPHHDPPPPVAQAPRPPRACAMNIRHLFSGRRLLSDIQHRREQLSAASSRSIFVQSIDVTNDATFGDLTNMASVA
ncbi:unnamed protein product, partial [Prorocentrum cordatum]